MLFSRPATATRDLTLPPRARPGQTKCDTERDKVEAPGVESLEMRYLPYVAFVILLASASLALRYLQKTR